MRTNEATTVQPIIAGVLAESSGRLGAAAAALIGLIGAVIGGRALARAAGRTTVRTGIAPAGRQRGAEVAMMLGLVAIVVGGIFVASADGGLGTGNGLGGAIVAMLFGQISTILGGLARARRRVVA